MINTGTATDTKETTVASASSSILTGTLPAPAVVTVTAGRTATVTSVAVHRHERPLALGYRGPIVGERIRQRPGNRGDAAGGHVLLVPDGWRSLSGLP